MANRSYWESIVGGRVSRRRALVATGTGALGAAFLAACGGSSKSGGNGGNNNSLITKPVDSTKDAKQGGIYKWFQPEEPSHFDAMLQNNPGSIVKDHVYSQLFLDEPGYLEARQYAKIRPVLATSYEWSPDLLTLTMKLRPNVKWHNIAPVNGRTVDVDDVLASWARFKNIGTFRSAYSNEVSPDAPITSFTAPDSSTLVMKLAFPVSYLVSMLANTGGGHFITFSKEAATGQVDPRNTAIGNGAFYMADYQPSQSMTFKRHEEHWEAPQPYIDQLNVPFISEYATQLSEFKSGNILSFISSTTGGSGNIKGEDVLSTKQSNPDIDIYQLYLPVVFNGRGAALGYLPGSPFLDVRVRQAISMAYDRELWIDTFGNISGYEAQGLPVESRWFSAMGAGSDWWLDPADTKNFGENAKYYQRDIATAKSLLSAAGFPNGLEVESRFPILFGDKESETLDNFVADIGIKTKRSQLDAGTEYPKYRDGNGQFTGWAYIVGAPLGNEPVAFYTWRYTPAGGLGFVGFDAAGKGDKSGDPMVTDMVKKMGLEMDTTKKQEMSHDLQRYLAKAQYQVVTPGQFSGFTTAWPALRNYNTYHATSWYPESTVSIDSSLPPFAKKS